MGIRRTVAAGLLAVALLGGCAGADQPSAPGGGSVTPSPTFPEDLPTPTSSGKPSEGPLMQISGTVVEGVEMGCRLLDEYLLLPGPGINGNELRAGATLTLRGQVQRGMMTTCQQGTPFLVVEIVSR